ncbi:MAG TPA: MerR family transcriptional regulator [Caulobacteraceae bacterium]|jgi:DNA-binding transcriptional MerR regulator|nr:MerR family transcriptional regulator [Caulobacteraceae bacterium]
MPTTALSEALTISQLCRQSGATPRALRYYEEMGLLSPRRDNQGRIYSRQDQVRLKLILHARRMGFSIKEIRELFEAYDKGGRDAQIARALPMFRERLAALALKRKEIDEVLETLTGASDRLIMKLEATGAQLRTG